MVNIALIDNHDSFTGNLYQLFDENNYCKIEIIQNDKVCIEYLNIFDKIVFSPGPDIPKESPIMFDILKEYAKSKSFLGICLGHQAIVEYFGGKLFNLPQVRHGIKERIWIDTADILFQNLPEYINVGLYHSWAAKKECLPECLSITAKSSTNTIMAVSHKKLDIKGIQFHPESYITENGAKIISNWIRK